MLNEMFVNDVLYAVLSKMEHNEQLRDWTLIMAERREIKLEV